MIMKGDIIIALSMITFNHQLLKYTIISILVSSYVILLNMI